MFPSVVSTVALALFSASLFSLSMAAIPSSGSVRAADTRSALDPSDFRIIPSKGNVVVTPDFTARIADLSTFPSLGGVDVQTQFVHGTIKPGASFIRHYHPRGSEFLFVLNGRLNVSFIDEGLSPQTISNIIAFRQGTVFPQGLVHTTTCISRHPCNFVSTFNSADPGIVPI